MPQQKYLWVFPNLLHAWIWKDMSRDLAAKTGLHPLFIIASKDDRKFWENQFGEPLEAEVAVHFDYLSYAMDGGNVTEPSTALATRAAAYENRHAITLMRDMVLGCRHIGRGFVLGGQGHPTSPVSKGMTQRLAVQTCLAIADDFEALAMKYPPGLMLTGGGGGGISMKSACLIARRDGVPFRSLVHSRFANTYLWADSEFEESEWFRALLNAQPTPNPEEVARAMKAMAPTGLSVVGFAAMRKDARWQSIAKRITLAYLRYFYGRWRGYRKSRIGVTPGSNARMMIRQRLDSKKLDKIAISRIGDLPDHLKVVYFPLQTEPEQSLNVLSPEHTNQLATAVELALSLPADAVLAIKEHPYQMGRRTAHYYDTLKQLPNAVFLNIHEPGIDVVKRADLVAVITGSAGYEAAVLGKPVLHFGKHGQALDLDHVYPMTGFANIGRITEILADDSEEAAEKRRRDGARYYLTVEKHGLDMSSFRAHGRKDRPTSAELAEISASLLKTLANDGANLCT
jgi:hypothetical protein